MTVVFLQISRMVMLCEPEQQQQTEHFQSLMLWYWEIPGICGSTEKWWRWVVIDPYHT